MCPEKYIPQKKRIKVLRQLEDRTLQEANTGSVEFFNGDDSYRKAGWLNFITSKGVIAVHTYTNSIRKGLITKLYCDREQAIQLEKEGIVKFPKSQLKK
jgi:hypothetical protein